MKYFASFWHSTGVLFRHQGWSWKIPLYLARSAFWYAAVALGREPRVRIPAWSASFSLPCLWRTPAKLFYVFRTDYEPEIRVFEELIGPGDWVIDVGANFGLYTVLSGKRVGEQGRVLAFEPFPDSFQILQKNRLLNGLEDIVQPWDCALGESPSTATLSVHADPGRNTLGSLAGETLSSMEISVRTLDEICDETNVPRLDLLKMDVEGFELQVLRGAARSIQRFKPMILFELNPPVCLQSGYEPSDIVQFLLGSGYLLFESSGPSEWKEVTPEHFGNYLGIHSERLADARFRAQKLRRLTR